MNVAPFTGAWIETVLLSIIIRVSIVAPFTGAWIETYYSYKRTYPLQSHPSRVRGLKLNQEVPLLPAHSSHPSRVRGLKHLGRLNVYYQVVVAPFTGAWIETCCHLSSSLFSFVAPFTGAWIETDIALDFCKQHPVAPFTGAWIETIVHLKFYKPFASRTLHGCVD